MHWPGWPSREGLCLQRAAQRWSGWPYPAGEPHTSSYSRVRALGHGPNSQSMYVAPGAATAASAAAVPPPPPREVVDRPAASLSLAGHEERAGHQHSTREPTGARRANDVPAIAYLPVGANDDGGVGGRGGGGGGRGGGGR